MRTSEYSPSKLRPWRAVVAGLAAAAACWTLPATAHAAVPGQTLLEGTLGSAGGAPASDGQYAVKFSLYKDAAAQVALWSETGTIEVKNGAFSYSLGSAGQVPAAVLENVTYMGLQVGADPELPRKPVQSSLFAMRATVAEALSCSGCISASALDQQLQGVVNTVKSLPDVAKSGNYGDLLGAPSFAPVAQSGAYKDLSGKPVLPVIGQSCGTGLVLAGFKADGSLDCVAGGAASLPGDGISTVSNGLIYNTFVDSSKGTLDVKIPDGVGAGVNDTVNFPDIGLAQKIWVQMDLSNADISTLKIELYGPGMATPYTLYNGGKQGTTLSAKFNDDTPLVSGDMNKDWVGKNIQGSWAINVKDLKGGNGSGGFDGKFNWSVNIQTLSNKKVQVKGDVIIDGKLTVGGKAITDNSNFTFRYALMSLHDPNYDWTKGNDAAYFLGVAPSSWSGGAVASSISSDKDAWRTVFTYGGRNRYGGVMWNEYRPIYSNSSAGHYAFFLFRIKNSTAGDIPWAPQFWYTSYGGWSDYTSATLNGANTWSSGGNDCYGANCPATPTFTIPGNRTSSVIFAVASGPAWCPNSQCHRALYFAFAKGALKLPTGLEFVDDLETATGGWDQ